VASVPRRDSSFYRKFFFQSNTLWLESMLDGVPLFPASNLSGRTQFLGLPRPAVLSALSLKVFFQFQSPSNHYPPAGSPVPALPPPGGSFLCQSVTQLCFPPFLSCVHRFHQFQSPGSRVFPLYSPFFPTTPFSRSPLGSV